MKELILKDQQALIFLNNLGNTAFDPFWSLVSERWFWIPLYVIFAYLLYKNYPRKSFFYILLFIGLGITVSDQMATLFKVGFLRLRPCHDPSLEGLIREVKCGGQYGFYSAHASNTFFLATVMTVFLGRKIKYLKYFLFTWAAVVAYSRIYLGMHFPGDVLFGAAMGSLLGLFFAYLTGMTLSRIRNKSANPYF